MNLVEKLIDETKVYKCLECGKCRASCPISWFENDYSPRMVVERALEGSIDISDKDIWCCTSCQLCSDRCPYQVDYPRFVWGLKYQAIKSGTSKSRMSELEEVFLEGELDEIAGVVRKTAAGKTKIEGQDGGVATSLLCAGIENGLFDSAVVVTKEEGFRAKSILGENTEEIIEAKGVKYQLARTSEKLAEVIKTSDIKKIAMVGTPCEIFGARQIQKTLLDSDIDITLIGLFCLESFLYHPLKEKLKEIMDVDLDQAEKVDIKRGKFYIYINGEEKSCDVGELDDVVRPSCAFCMDFTARLADISLGSVGSPDGYTTALIRSKKGEELFNLLNGMEKEEPNVEDVKKLASFKIKKNTKNLEKVFGGA